MANPTLLDMPIARDGNKNTIPTTDNGTTGLLSQQYGWQLINAIPPQQGGKAVKREDFNGVFNLLSNILFYAQKGWQWEFDETQSYFAGCTVKDTADGKTYVCIADVNASTTHPSSDTTHWQLLDLATKGDLTNYLPLSGGYMTGSTGIRNAVDNDALGLYGAPNWNDGSYISLYGNRAAVTGIDLFAYGADGNYKQMALRNDGSLLWAGNDLAGSAIVAKNIIQNGYIKLASGEIRQWGLTGGFLVGETYKDITLPLSFINGFCSVVAIQQGAPTNGVMGCEILGHSQFRIHRADSQYSNNSGCYWLAVGF